MSETISIANLPTGTPTTDDVLVFVDRADGVTKRADWSEFPAAAGDMLASTYDPAGIAQQVVGTTAPQTISGKTFTAPKFVDNGFIADSNGNEMLAFNQNASAVNYIELENGATGNPVHMRAKGDDSIIGLHLVPKGATGYVNISDPVDETKRVRFDVANNGTGIITTLRSNSTGTSKTIDLPNATDTLVGKATTDTLTNKDISSATNTYRSASDTVVGAVELATIAETNTGTDANRALTPDGLAGSNFGISYVACSLNGTTALTTSDKAYFRIPPAFTGMNLVTVRATVGTGASGSSSSGVPTFTVKNVTDGNQMLSTSLTVDASEYTSATAATPAVINTSFDDVVTDDLIEVACTVAGTGVTYATITLGFQLA